LEAIDAALRANPWRIESWFVKADLLSKGLWDCKQALECLEQALEFHSDSIDLRHRIRDLKREMQGDDEFRRLRKRRSKAKAEQGCAGALLMLIGSTTILCAAFLRLVTG
jgi:hypothetical protein